MELKEAFEKNKVENLKCSQFAKLFLLPPS